jgi:hypothetical protein
MLRCGAPRCGPLEAPGDLGFADAGVMQFADLSGMPRRPFRATPNRTELLSDLVSR